MNGQVVATGLFAEKQSIAYTSKIWVYPEVLYPNLESDFAGIRPPRGKTLNDMEYLALALDLGRNLPC